MMELSRAPRSSPPPPPLLEGPGAGGGGGAPDPVGGGGGGGTPGAGGGGGGAGGAWDPETGQPRVTIYIYTVPFYWTTRVISLFLDNMGNLSLSGQQG